MGFRKKLCVGPLVRHSALASSTFRDTITDHWEDVRNKKGAVGQPEGDLVLSYAFDTRLIQADAESERSLITETGMRRRECSRILCLITPLIPVD
jgi:hypothetical protein